MFTPINASKVLTGRKPLPAFRKNPENILPTASTETPAPAWLGEAHKTTTTTSFSATSITPPWAIKYERGHLGDLLIPLEAGKHQDLRSHFRGNGKMECPVYNNTKPSWAYVHYVLLSLVPGGKVRSNVLYDMGIEWIPALEKKAAVNEEGQEKKQRKNQSCGSALTRGREFVCELDDKGEKTKFWYLADSVDGEPKVKKRKMKEENVQDENGYSSSMPEKPAAKKVKDHSAMPIRTILKGKNEDAVNPQRSNVPNQDGTFSNGANGSSSFPLAYHQDPRREGFELVAHDERRSDPDEDMHNSAQPLPSLLPSAAPSGHKQPHNLPPIARLLDEAGIHRLLDAAVELGDLPRQPGYPGIAVGPHPYGTPAALPNAGQTLREIEQQAGTRRDVSNKMHRATYSRVTFADPAPNEWFPRSAKERDVAHILADMRLGWYLHGG